MLANRLPLVRSDLPTLLTVDEVCRITALSRGFVYERLANGDLPSVKLGRARRIKVDDVRKLIDAATR